MLLPQRQPAAPAAPAFWVPSVARCRQSIARRKETGVSFRRPHCSSEHTRVLVPAPLPMAMPSLCGDGCVYRGKASDALQWLPFGSKGCDPAELWFSLSQLRAACRVVQMDLSYRAVLLCQCVKPKQFSGKINGDTESGAVITATPHTPPPDLWIAYQASHMGGKLCLGFWS